MNCLKFISLLVLSSCALQTPYEPPIIDIPTSWHSEHGDSSATDCLIWWENLQDSQLNELMELAAAQNLDMQIGAMRVLQARSEANGKKGDLYPHVDASFNCGHVSYDKKALRDVIGHCGGKRNFNFFEIGFDAEWEIDFFGMTAHEICALKAHEEAVREDLSSLWVTLSGEIAKNYIQLRGFQQRLSLIQEKIILQTNEIALADELKKRGILTDREFNKTQSELNTLKASEPLIVFEISRAIHRLSILLGLNPAELFICLENISSVPELPSKPPLGMPSELLQRRPDIKKAERELAAATERVQSAIAALFPRFSLWGFIGDVGTRAGSLFNPSSAALAVGPQILLPIFNSRLLLQDVEYNKIATKQALFTYQKTVLEALEEAENAIAAYQLGEQRLYYTNESYRILEESRRNELELYTKGLSSYITLSASSKDALSAEETLIQARVDQLLNYVAIYKALGGNWD